MIRNLLFLILSIFITEQNPTDLHKKKEKSSFEQWCDKVAPYVIIVALILLILLVFVVMIKYGGIWFGTEANRFYNGGFV